MMLEGSGRRPNMIKHNAVIRGLFFSRGRLGNALKVFVEMGERQVNLKYELFEEEWNGVMAKNLTGTWLVTKYACRLMCDANLKGSVIDISSIAGVDQGQLLGRLAYAISKAGVNTMAQVMALELGQYDICQLHSTKYIQIRDD